jgi:hypothetical protein
MNHAKYFIQNKGKLLGLERIRKINAIMTLLIKKCTKESEHKMLDDLEVLNVFNLSLLEHTKLKYCEKTGMEWHNRISEDFIKFYLNKNFFKFFGKDVTAELR